MAVAQNRLVRDENGRFRVVFVDAETQQPISDLSGYTVQSSNTSPVPVPNPISTEPRLEKPKASEDPNNDVSETEFQADIPDAPSPASSIVEPFVNRFQSAFRDRTKGEVGEDEEVNEGSGTNPLTRFTRNVQEFINPETPSLPSQRSTPAATSSSNLPREQSVPVLPSATQNLEQIQKANVTYNIDGKNRDQRPDYETVDRVRVAVGKSLPGYTINVTSGGGEYGSDRHRKENNYRAFDFSLIDPNGKPVTPQTDPQVYQQVAESIASHGIKGIGHYGWGMHADTVRENAWGPTTGLASLDTRYKGAIEKGRANQAEYTFGGMPVPTPRGQTQAPKSGLNIADTSYLSPPSITPNFDNMTAGELAFSGYLDPPDEMQIKDMAFTLAGELDGGTLRNLTSSDPTRREEARKELANAVATVDNRIRSVGIERTLTPSQYNSLMRQNLSVTDSNYKKFGTDLEDAILQTYTGDNKPTNPNATHYANMSISNPSWRSAMTDVQQVGHHTFGTIANEYQTPQEVRDEMAAKARSSFEQSTPNARPSSPPPMPEVKLAEERPPMPSFEEATNKFENPLNKMATQALTTEEQKTQPFQPDPNVEKRYGNSFGLIGTDPFKENPLSQIQQQQPKIPSPILSSSKEEDENNNSILRRKT